MAPISGVLTWGLIVHRTPTVASPGIVAVHPVFARDELDEGLPAG